MNHSDDLFKAFTNDMSKPFTTIRCPECGYRGQVTSEWAVLSGKKMSGSCDWCEYESKRTSENKAKCDFLVETWSPLIKETKEVKEEGEQNET